MSRHLGIPVSSLALQEPQYTLTAGGILKLSKTLSRVTARSVRHAHLEMNPG